MGGGSIDVPDLNEPESQSLLVDTNDDYDIEEYTYKRWNHRIFVSGKLIINAEAIVEVV